MSCTLCGGALEPVASMRGVPTFCNVLLATREAAVRAPRGDIELAFCTACGAGRNLAFDPVVMEYQDGYENSLHCSPTFQAYAEELAQRLVTEHALHGATVLEIGAGRGEFLELLCDAGGAGTTGVGVDPSLPTTELAVGPSVHLLRGLFPDTGGDTPVDAVVCRHVLEHVDAPMPLVSAMGNARRAGAELVVYVEVPDALHMVRTGGVWDLLYEHAWYFSRPALERMFAGRDLEVRTGTAFGGQYLWIEARAPTSRTARATTSADDGPSVDDVLSAAREFGDAVHACRAAWADVLTEHRRSGARVAVWGVGTKGTTFLNWVPGAEAIATVVDVNPRKHGRFVPGTGQRVVGPDDLVAHPPDTVLVMNAMYADEIREALDRLGLDTDVVVVERAVRSASAAAAPSSPG